jgi:hypothetical protein
MNSRRCGGLGLKDILTGGAERDVDSMMMLQ